MREIYRDKAGNKILQNPLTGGLEGRNAEGELVDKSSFQTLAKRAGIHGAFAKKNEKYRI